MRNDIITITNSEIEELIAAKTVAFAKEQAVKELEKKEQEMAIKGDEMTTKIEEAGTNATKQIERLGDEIMVNVEAIGTSTKEQIVIKGQELTTKVKTETDRAVQAIRVERMFLTN